MLYVSEKDVHSKNTSKAGHSEQKYKVSIS